MGPPEPEISHQDFSGMAALRVKNGFTVWHGRVGLGWRVRAGCRVYLEGAPGAEEAGLGVPPDFFREKESLMSKKLT
jgi:hypothetical protein